MSWREPAPYGGRLSVFTGPTPFTLFSPHGCRVFFRSAFALLKESGVKFAADKCGRLGAALAFYTLLSLAPMLLVVIGIASTVYGQDAAEGKVAAQIKDQMGDEGAKAVESMLAANQVKGGSAVSIAVGLVTLVFGATGVFAQLQDALNAVWKTEAASADDAGYLRMAWEYVRDRLLSLSMIAVLAFLLLVSTVFGAAVNGMSDTINGYLPFGQYWLLGLNVTLSVLVTAAMFAMIFKILPAVHVPWRDVWVGAVVTAVLFNVGKFGLSLYLGGAAVGSSYGAAGSVVVLLIWVYYSTQILLFGAEFTQIYGAKYGVRPRVTGATAPGPPSAAH